MKAYRKRLAEAEANLGPLPSEDRWISGHSHQWFTLDWKAQRLAVLDHDVDAIIRTHAKLEAGAQHYRLAARRLAKTRELAAGSGKAVEVDELIADLRETHRRRPRLQQEFDRAGLPC